MSLRAIRRARYWRRISGLETLSRVLNIGDPRKIRIHDNSRLLSSNNLNSAPNRSGQPTCIASNFCTLLAVLLQEKVEARLTPFVISRERKRESAVIFSIARDICSVDRGSTSNAASAAISGIAVMLDVTTGIPQAIASKTGRPNPS